MKLTTTNRNQPPLIRRQSRWTDHRTYRLALAEMEAEYYRLSWRDEQRQGVSRSRFSQGEKLFPGVLEVAA